MSVLLWDDIFPVIDSAMQNLSLEATGDVARFLNQGTGMGLLKCKPGNEWGGSTLSN